MTLTESAYAKINLALHIRRRREDGYHELVDPVRRSSMRAMC